MGPRCPDASARLRNTLSPGSHKSGFYAAMNRGKQWIYFRPQGNQLSLGPSPAIRSLNMAGLRIPCRPVSLTKTTPCLGLGEEIPPSLGPVAARPPLPCYGRRCTGQPQRLAGPGWWSLPYHPILGSRESALGLGGGLSLLLPEREPLHLPLHSWWPASARVLLLKQNPRRTAWKSHPRSSVTITASLCLWTQGTPPPPRVNIVHVLEVARPSESATCTQLSPCHGLRWHGIHPHPRPLSPR